MQDNNSNNRELALVRETDTDLILEHLMNINVSMRKKVAIQYIGDALKTRADHECNIRQSTVTFNNDKKHELKEFIRHIDEKWIGEKNNLPVTIFKDREFTYCQFINKQEKETFLEWIKNETYNTELLNNLKDPNKKGEHYLRKPAKLEIMNVKPKIKAGRILEIIKLSMNNNDKETIQIKESKPHFNNNRNILIQVNSEAFSHIYGNLNGEIIYADKDKNKAKLKIMINARPWPCKNCLVFGRHECKRTRCTKCGEDNHTIKNCIRKTSYCPNCNQKGHKAKEIGCPIYLREALKELRHMDIPIDYYKDDILRSRIMDSVILK